MELSAVLMQPADESKLATGCKCVLCTAADTEWMESPKLEYPQRDLVRSLLCREQAHHQLSKVESKQGTEVSFRPKSAMVAVQPIR